MSKLDLSPSESCSSQLPKIVSHVLKKLDHTLTVCPRAGIFGLALACVALVGDLDYVTGLEVSLSVFHLIPVSLAVWYGGKAVGLPIAIIASLVWSGDDIIAGYTHGHPGILVWDIVVHFVFFSVHAALLEMLRNRLTTERLLARKDSLTDVFNLRAFHERLEYSFALSARSEQPLTLVYIDLDDFKRINDVHGHSQGDLVLATVGRVLLEAIRNTDTVARIGGDEFVLLLPDTATRDAVDVLLKLAQHLPTRLNLIDLPTTMSMGAVTFTRPPDNVHAAIHAADRLMYQVKRRGKGAVAFGVFDNLSGTVVEVS